MIKSFGSSISDDNFSNNLHQLYSSDLTRLIVLQNALIFPEKWWSYQTKSLPQIEEGTESSAATAAATAVGTDTAGCRTTTTATAGRNC